MKASISFLGYVRVQFSTCRFTAPGNSARGLQKSVWGGTSVRVTFHTFSISWSLSGKVVAPRSQEEEVVTTVVMTPGHGRCHPGIEYTT